MNISSDSSINMDTAVLSYMSFDEIELTFQTAKLEQAYERALQQSERIYEEERARVLRVHLALLEHDNDTLQEEVAENEVKLDQLADGNQEIREQLLEAEEDLQQAQNELRSRTRDLEHHKAEVNALHATNSDSTKILTEKLALAREVANLRPELEHLRTQAAAQSNLLAEKLALQREVSSLHVELETEKRAVHRTKEQDKSSTDNSGNAAQVETLKKEIAKEKREATKAKNRASEFEAEKETLENKLEAFRNKLRATKEQFKEVQTELEEAQAAKAKPAVATTTKSTMINPRKRPVARFDPDMTIGTPGKGGHASKKVKKSALPGDKSTFSITPFLNRTMSILPESPSGVNEEDAHSKADNLINTQIDTLAAQAERSSPRVTAAGATQTIKPKSAQPLKESTFAKTNAALPKPRLEKVTEEGDEENSENPSDLPVIEPAKKKQKLLGAQGQRKSLFDAEDDTGPAKIKGTMPLGLRGGGAAFGKVNLLGNKAKTLTEFSPLKKDRRAAAASFLG